ncbi:MAG: coenzyme PQQ synthesis protein E [Rhodomicrobium sp.]|nr:MAG: coenzyme PQQ synthesis protein E [Rhodomicrobium sp.]
MIEAQEQNADVICATAPMGLLAELTHRCPLQCPYCSNPVDLERASGELSTEDWVRVFKEAGDLGILQTHLSGGEPTVRKDLEQITKAAVEAGIYTNLITAGVLLSKERLEGLRDVGLDHVQLSIQHVDAKLADKISGFKGGYSKKLELAKWVKELDLPLTVNSPMHRHNVEYLEEIIEFAVRLGAERLEVAHIQYYGWAFDNRTALIPTKEQVYRNADIVDEARERLKGIMSIDFVVPDYYAVRPKPCMGGWGSQFITISPTGKVLPCHAAASIKGMEFDNVKDKHLRDIWLHSSAFEKYRGTDYLPDPCKSCEFREVDFGGCRCQAFMFTGDAANTDPACAKSPHHKDLLAIAEQESQREDKEFIYRKFTKTPVTTI